MAMKVSQLGLKPDESDVIEDEPEEEEKPLTTPFRQTEGEGSGVPRAGNKKSFCK